MRSSCGWETISHGQGCAGELEGGLCRRALLPGRKTVSLGGQAQVFWQIFLDVSLGFNSDDAVRPFPSSHTALPCKLRRFMVCICPSCRLAVCQLLWDDQTSRLNADNPQPERPQVLPLPLALPAASLRPSHKTSGEHLGSQQHKTNAVLAIGSC